MAGYDIHVEISQTFRLFWRESEGQIYPTLKRLRIQGYIAPVKARTKQARDRKVYTITRKGRQLLRGWIAEPPRDQPPRNEFLLKVLLMRYGPRGSVLKHVAEYRERTAGWIAAIEQLQIQMKKNEEFADFPVWMALSRYFLLEKRAEMLWCDQNMKLLKSISEAVSPP